MNTKKLLKMVLQKDLDDLNNQHYHIDQKIYDDIIDQLLATPLQPNIQGLLLTLDSFKKTTDIPPECARAEFSLLKDEFFNKKENHLNLPETPLDMLEDSIENRALKEKLKWFMDFQNEQAPLIYEQARTNGGSIYQCIEHLTRELGAGLNEVEEKTSQSIHRHYLRVAITGFTAIAGALATMGVCIYKIAKDMPKTEPKIEHISKYNQSERE